MQTITALTVRQPWASAIFLGKDVENRTRRFHHRGPLLIHAATHWSAAGFRDPRIKELGFVHRDQLPTGALIGVVIMLDCVRDHPSRWADPDCYQLVLANPHRFVRPVPYLGKLMPFRVPVDLVHDQIPRGLVLTPQSSLPLDDA